MFTCGHSSDHSDIEYAGPMNAPRRLLCVLALTLLPAASLADVVKPPPLVCPPGHTPRTGHGGPYCAPPLRTDCAPGYEPRVQRTDAYCEPPPERPCPPGSMWRSTSATRTWCEGGSSCAERDCGENWTCREEGLCVTSEMRWRGQRYEVASRACTRDADCTGPEETCVVAKRCDPDVKRRRVDGGQGTPEPSTATPGEEPTPAAHEPKPAAEEPKPAAEEPKPEANEPGDDEVGTRPGCAVVAPSAAGGLLLLPLLALARRRR